MIDVMYGDLKHEFDEVVDTCTQHSPSMRRCHSFYNLQNWVNLIAGNNKICRVLQPALHIIDINEEIFIPHTLSPQFDYEVILVLLIQENLEMVSIAHANVIVIDHIQKTIARFDPAGVTLSILDVNLRKSILRTVSQSYTYITSSHYPNVTSIQRHVKNSSRDKYGNWICVICCYLFIHLRIKCRNSNLFEVSKIMVSMDSSKTTEFISKYARMVENRTENYWDQQVLNYKDQMANIYIKWVFDYDNSEWIIPVSKIIICLLISVGLPFLICSLVVSILSHQF